MEEELEDPINITVKTINNSAFELKISRNISIRALKTKIKDATDIAEDRQRLIYRGQVLADQSSLNDYSIEDGHTIHLVSRPHNFREMQQSVENTAANDANIAAEQSRNLFRSLQEQVFASSNPLLGLQSLGDATFQSNRETNQGTPQQQRAAAENSLEHIRQGFLTINTLMSTMIAVGVPERNSEEEDSYEDLGAPFTIKSPNHSLRKSLRNDSSGLKDTNESAEGNEGCRKRRREPGLGVGRGDRNRTEEKDSNATADMNTSAQLAPCKSTSSADYSEDDDQNNDQDDEDDEQNFPFEDEQENILSTVPDTNVNTNINITSTTNNQNVINSLVDMNSITSGMYSSTTPTRPPITLQNQATQYFVGQWLDVRDTVNQWLEATVLQAEINDLGMQRVFVHYNGWPSRWDEWLPSDSQRIAPFRTRTVHSTTLPHSSPSPSISAPFIQSTGHDDVRELLPELFNMLRRITPAIEEVASLSAQSLVDRPIAVAVPVAPLFPTNNYSSTSVDSNSSSTYMTSEGQEGDVPAIPPPINNTTSFSTSSSSTTGIRRRGAESPRMRLLASELCPILDRLGRILTDLSPHLKSLADDTDEEDVEVVSAAERGDVAFTTSNSTTSSNSNNSRRRRSNRPSQHAEDDSVLGGFGSSTATATTTSTRNSRSIRRLNRLALRDSTTRSLEDRSNQHRSRVTSSNSDGALLSILSPRTTSQTSDTVYRQPILSSSVRPGSSPFGGGGMGMMGSSNNHLDIHIHAILTPFRQVGRFSANDTPLFAPTTTASTDTTDTPTATDATSTTALSTMAESIVNDFMAMETNDMTATDITLPSSTLYDSSAPPTTTSTDSSTLPASPDLPLSSPLILPSTSFSELSVNATSWIPTPPIEPNHSLVVLSTPPNIGPSSLHTVNSYHNEGDVPIEEEVDIDNQSYKESQNDSSNSMHTSILVHSNPDTDIITVADRNNELLLPLLGQPNEDRAIASSSSIRVTDNNIEMVTASSTATKDITTIVTSKVEEQHQTSSTNSNSDSQIQSQGHVIAEEETVAVPSSTTTTTTISEHTSNNSSLENSLLYDSNNQSQSAGPIIELSTATLMERFRSTLSLFSRGVGVGVGGVGASNGSSDEENEEEIHKPET